MRYWRDFLASHEDTKMLRLWRSRLVNPALALDATNREFKAPAAQGDIFVSLCENHK